MVETDWKTGLSCEHSVTDLQIAELDSRLSLVMEMVLYTVSSNGGTVSSLKSHRATRNSERKALGAGD